MKMYDLEIYPSINEAETEAFIVIKQDRGCGTEDDIWISPYQIDLVRDYLQEYKQITTDSQMEINKTMAESENDDV